MQSGLEGKYQKVQGKHKNVRDSLRKFRRHTKNDRKNKYRMTSPLGLLRSVVYFY